MVGGEYFELLQEAVHKYGGLHNAHLHLDRAGTLARRYLEHMSMDPIEASSYSLRIKQNLTGDLHRGPAYEEDDLRRRMSDQLEVMINCGTRRADTCIDVSDDNVQLSAFNIAMELKEQYKDRIDLRVGAYPIFGFKDDTYRRWELFVEAAQRADFLTTLPERDDAKYHKSHIGFDEHFRRVQKLAIDLGKPIHYHVDQANDPRENGTETLIEVVRWIGSPNIDEDGPSVWAVHSISPAAYDSERMNAVIKGMYEYNIGLICCPSAAISMRQLRPIKTPTHNSIAMVLEALVQKVSVRIGSDNVNDVFLPSTTANLYDELQVLSNAVRFYNPDILAKVACSQDLTDMDRELIERTLEQDNIVFDDIRRSKSE